MRAVEFRPVREGDIEALLADMRLSDLLELYASTDATPEEAVVQSVRSSVVLHAVAFDGRLAALLGVGVVGMAPLIGAPWMLGTRWLDENPRALIAATRVYSPQLLGQFKHLLNFVDARNTASIRWLRAIGFKIREAQPYGPRGLPFHRFDIGFEPCVFSPPSALSAQPSQEQPAPR